MITADTIEYAHVVRKRTCICGRVMSVWTFHPETCPFRDLSELLFAQAEKEGPMDQAATDRLFDELTTLRIDNCSCGCTRIHPDPHETTCPYRSLAPDVIEAANKQRKEP